MKAQIITLFVFVLLVHISCSKDKAEPIEENPDAKVTGMYFPPLATKEWETISMEELEWNTQAIQPLTALLKERDTKAFIILKNGRIVLEEYFGTFVQDSIWYWASAGKTLTAFTVGIAQENGFLALGNKTSEYLGEGWTSLTPKQENKITVWNQLTMTTGLNGVTVDCKLPTCLIYIADAGTRWNYHNAPYTLLQNVISAATNTDYTAYFNTMLRNKIGMNGFWVTTNGDNSVYFSNARSMARFGLLNLNNGKWGEETILGDTTYLNDMKNTSQDLNKSYGYLWWLNGKESYMAPTLQTIFDGTLITNAPADMYSGLGKNDQKLYIVPSQGLVIIRMGNDSGEDLLGPSSFDNELWDKINDVIN